MRTADRRQKRSLDWLKAAVLLVTAVGILIRFTNLDNKPFWWDEILTLTFSAGYTTGEVEADLGSAPRVKAVDQVLQLQRASPERGLTDVMRPLREETVQPPIFFALLHLWELHVGDSMRLIRALPAVLSLLVLPAAWWFCRGLFGSERVAWLSVSLLSVSPLHLAYAQEVRQYSLWTAMILVTCAVLLRALEGGSRKAWLAFSLAATASLYTHLLTGFLLMGLGVYVLYRERWRFSSKVEDFLISLALVGVAFGPWLLALTDPRRTFTRLQYWTGERFSTGSPSASWGENLSRMIFDFSNFPARPTEGAANVIGAVAVALLCACAVLALARKPDRRPLWFLAAMAVPGAAILGGWDALQGGIRSDVPRFLIPSYLGLHIAIAHLLSEGLRGTSSRWIRDVSILVLIGLWGLGAVSSWQNSQSNQIWSKPQSGSIHWAAETINAGPSALVLHAGIPALGLAWKLDPNVKLMSARRAAGEERIEIPPGSGEVYGYALTGRLRKQLSRDYELTPVIGGAGEPRPQTILCRVTRKTNVP